MGVLEPTMVSRAGKSLILTVKGENYMRNLERALKANEETEPELKGKSLTLMLFKRISTVAQDFVIQMAAQIVATKLGG